MSKCWLRSATGQKIKNIKRTHFLKRRISIVQKFTPCQENLGGRNRKYIF